MPGIVEFVRSVPDQVELVPRQIVKEFERCGTQMGLDQGLHACGSGSGGGRGKMQCVIQRSGRFGLAGDCGLRLHGARMSLETHPLVTDALGGTVPIRKGPRWGGGYWGGNCGRLGGCLRSIKIGFPGGEGTAHETPVAAIQRER